MAAPPKKVVAKIKLQIPGGQANPSPPVGPALGQHGVNMMQFCQAFNAQSKDQMGKRLSVFIDVFQDRTFKFIVKTEITTDLIKKAAAIQKGSPIPNKEKVGKITKSQVKEIAQIKMRDLNATTMEAAMRIIEGSARSMGIDVVG